MQAKQDTMMEMFTQMMKRLERLENDKSPRDGSERLVSQGQESKNDYAKGGVRRQRQQKDPTICRRCLQEGHYAQGCAQPRSNQQVN